MATILIVDDEIEVLSTLKRLLELKEYEVITASNGVEALEKMNVQIDIILMDVIMPVMNGFELCRIIKGREQFRNISVIMITALVDKLDRIKGIEAGADDFISKPIDSGEVLARVKMLIEMKSLRDDLELRNHLISSMLHRYVNSSVIEQILANPEKYLELGGDRKKVAVFFCDIRGFTSISENINADELIRLLNSIYKELTGIVFRNKGTFDKYIGDCVMAFWGAPIDIEDETLWAVRAAMEMQGAFEDLKQGWPPQLKKIGIGIGINYGELVVGNIGTEEAMDYTVIGDVVNTAQRLESIARAGQVLITKNALLRVEGKIKVRKLEPVQLKGKSLPVEIFEVLKVEEKL
jgi:adenylate cyclase